jgi:hypothetical protein
VRAPDRLHGFRVVASPQALDRLTWPDGSVTLRLAPDDLFVVGPGTFAKAGEPAIVEQEAGFVGWWLTLEELHEHVLEHVDWPLPASRPALAQGLIAGVPAKLWLTLDRALLLCPAAYAHELEARLP